MKWRQVVGHVAKLAACNTEKLTKKQKNSIRKIKRILLKYFIQQNAVEKLQEALKKPTIIKSKIKSFFLLFLFTLAKV